MMEILKSAAISEAKTPNDPAVSNQQKTEVENLPEAYKAESPLASQFPPWNLTPPSVLVRRTKNQ